jgi:hypothetical protein
MFKHGTDGNLLILNNADRFIADVTPMIAGNTGREESQLLFTLGTFL